MMVTFLACATVLPLTFACGWLWRDTSGGIS
jgi:hypothetical protein